MALVSLVHAASNMNNIINFVEGISFLEALSVIGDNELEAAKLAMQSTGKAHDKKREVTLAVGHLQSAHIAYRSIWQRTHGSALGRSTRLLTLDLARQRDRYISCLTALCYVYLGEFQLARSYVTFAKEADQAWEELVDGQSAGDLFTSGIISMIREPGKAIESFKDKTPKIDMKAFSEAIEQHL